MGSWDLSRGGIDSLADSPDLSPVRSLIVGEFPNITFSSTGTLTPEYLATTDAFFLGTLFSTVQAITPLSADEQVALYNYVSQGGSLFIGIDNYAIAGAPATYNSALSPFGMQAVSRVAIGPAIANVVAPTHPLVSGPFGSFSTLSLNAHCLLSDLGLYGISLAETDGKTVLAVIEDDSITLGSGAVIVLTDLDALTPALVLNSIAYLSVPEASTVLLTAYGSLVFLVLRHRSLRQSA